MIKPLLLILPLLLAACGTTPTPEQQAKRHTIQVKQLPDGSYAAVGPNCTPYTDASFDRWQNDSLPQLGCSTANNLAKQIANPADLVRGKANKPTMPASGTTSAASVQRYNEGKVYKPSGLLNNSTTSQ